MYLRCNAEDPSTQSNYKDVLASNYSLFWNIDFEEKRIEGGVSIVVRALKDTEHIILDGRRLDIVSVDLDGKEVGFKITEDEVLGQKIDITIPMLKQGFRAKLFIKYRTASEPQALQFLNKEQTNDKKAAYLFSNCQAINARSILPCMDTPAVKSTYQAEVSVPSDMTVLMSAIYEKTREENGKKWYHFKQEMAIPAYLLAIVVGCLEKREINEKCCVWSEPSQVDAAHWEFQETGKFLDILEDMLGPYEWGRYDMVVLPPTFALGGMENPCLTFVTPTLIAGDRSNVTTIAHELIHSWMGNLVTNKSWEHFWLNEGFTVYIERKIHAVLKGEKERHFELERGWQENLVPTIHDVFGEHHEFTKLVFNQKNIEPDDTFSSVPYEKGSAFLFHIEQTLGQENERRYEEFMKSYVQRFKYQSITTDMFKEYLYEFFDDEKEKLDEIDWDLWLYQPGLPPRPKFDSSIMGKCRYLASEWISDEIPTDPSEFNQLTTAQKNAVIDNIRHSGEFTKEKTSKLTDLYQLDKSKNCEILYRWMMIGLETEWTPIIEPSLDFVLRVGRMKYCKPIYTALFRWSVTHQRAKEQFLNNIGSMHPRTARVIQKLLEKQN